MITSVTQGASCLGTIIYLSRDKRTLEQRERGETLLSAERVAWIHTENLLGIEDAEFAGRLMDETAFYSRTKKHCYHLSLSWHPDQPAPSKEHMIAQGQAVMRVLQVEEHQVTMVAHTDTAHPHMHLVINRVHPEKLIAANMYQDRVKLSAWALKYERAHGRIVCIQREERAKAREAALARGEQFKDTRYVDNTLAECWTQSRDGQSFKAALEARGWGLAKGDRKDGVLMVVTKSGRAFAIKRELNKGLPKGQKLTGADIDRKVSDLDRATLKSVAEVQREIEGKRQRGGERSQGQAVPCPRRRRKGETKAQEREEAERKAQAKAAAEAKEKARQAERARFEVWASRQRALLQDKHFEERGQLGNRQQDERLREEALIKENYLKGQAAQKERLREIEASRERGGFLYRMTRAKAEQAEEQAIRLSLANGAQRAQERKGALALKHDAEWKAQAETEQRRIQALEVRIMEAEARREREGVQAPSLKATRDQPSNREPEASPREERAQERSQQTQRAPPRDHGGGFERGR